MMVSMVLGPPSSPSEKSKQPQRPLFEEKVEAVAFVVLKKTDGDTGQQVGLAGDRRTRHVRPWLEAAAKSSCS